MAQELPCNKLQQVGENSHHTGLPSGSRYTHLQVVSSLSAVGMHQASDERVLGLLRCANQLLLTHPEARRRNLQASPPGIA